MDNPEQKSPARTSARSHVESTPQTYLTYDRKSTAGSFFKAMRSPDALEMIKASRNAFLLLYIIAYRAQRTDAFNRYGLKPGEALVGDYKNYGMTEREYRTAKQLLGNWQKATFKGTSLGTIATLTDSTVFDINIQLKDERPDVQETDERRTSDGRATTTKNEKKGNNGKECKEAILTSNTSNIPWEERE